MNVFSQPARIVHTLLFSCVQASVRLIMGFSVMYSNPKQSRQQLHFIVQNSAYFYCPQKDIYLEGTQTLTGIFVHNNGLRRRAAYVWETRNPSRRQV